MQTRNTRTFAFAALLAASAAAMPAISFEGCEAKSGAVTAALVELYTSEGCSSCPPADRQLSRLREALGPSAVVVPLSMHVDYWDYIGWKDPYAQGAFAKRQRWLASENQGFVYTPHFFVSGIELQPSQDAMRDQVRRTNARPAEAHIRIEASLASTDTLALTADAIAPGAVDRADLYLAVTENGLVSKVTRGENDGATLAHDHVVRAWIGPIPLAKGQAQVRREVPLSPSWNRAQLEIAGFIEDRSSGKVLQAVQANACFRS